MLTTRRARASEHDRRGDGALMRQPKTRATRGRDGAAIDPRTPHLVPTPAPAVRAARARQKMSKRLSFTPAPANATPNIGAAKQSQGRFETLKRVG